MGVFGYPPTFTAGQVLSATAHMNTLQEYVQGLADVWRGPQLPFAGQLTMQQKGWSFAWSGVIRHKYNSFRWEYVILKNGPLSIYINGNLVPGSNTSPAGVVDISSMGLTENQFYDITITAPADTYFQLWLLREERTPVYPTLANFNDGDVPTAAEWQALSDYASEISNRLDYPGAPVSQYHIKMDGNSQDLGFYPQLGIINHRCRHLAYSIYLRTPYWGDTSIYSPPESVRNTGERWSCARIYANGSLAAKFVIGSSHEGADGVGEWFQYVPGGPGSYHTFSGVLDLDVYPGGITPGADYKLFVHCKDSTYWDTDNECRVNYIYEVPDMITDTLGLTPFVDWAHGNYVYGSTSSPRVQTVKTNMQLMAAYNVYHNNATRQILNAENINTAFMVRRWRYLHYRNPAKVDEVVDPNGVIIVAGVNPKPTISWYYQGKKQTANLPDASTRWMAYDLDSAPGLFPGIEYEISGLVTYAIEDWVP